MQDKFGTNAPTVLVVEDEMLSRLAAAMMLEDAGYAVISVPDADEAVSALKRCSNIRALFTDINIPGSMDGLALAHQSRLRMPNLVIVIASGATDVDKDDLPAAARFLSKPYSHGEVTNALSELMR